jgi:ectoine hydroxylase-related dioxygenase (phytanoyl-CoA dioxygenase family)
MIDVIDFQNKGYARINGIYTSAEVKAIGSAIDQADASDTLFRRTADLFAIRQFLKMVPAVRPLIFTPKLRALIAQTFGPDYFVVKSIYFDKTPGSNWFVAWHQDLTISVDRKVALPDYGPWTVKGDQFAVQPPPAILQAMFTVRIHLDDTDETNGALRVIPESHKGGIERYSHREDQSEEVCRVSEGGVMFMRPLLQHASSRSTGGKRRRVIHIEFSNASLPDGLEWSERLLFSQVK